MISTNIGKAFALLDRLGDQVVQRGGISRTAIGEVERILGLRLPESYSLFLSRYGAIEIGPIAIYGITLPTNREPSMVWALARLWTTSPDVPKNLIPIRLDVSTGLFTCLQCQETSSGLGDAQVVIWDPSSPLTEQNPQAASPDFGTYLFDCLMQWKYRETGLKTMEGHVRQFEEDYLKADKLPRNHVWRPHRFCSRDVVLGLVVVKHSLSNNCLDVDVCLTTDVPEFEPQSGAKVTTLALLSEAYKCGGTMEIRFTEYVEDGRVPRALCDLANSQGVVLNHIDEGRITASEARQLYLALSDFSPDLRAQIESLSSQGRLSRERACYDVHHGLWARPELEMIILGSSHPDSLLGGEALPEQRHLYVQDLRHAQAALLGGFLDRKLSRRERKQGDSVLDLEDDAKPLVISFKPEFYAKVYHCEEELDVPWLADMGQIAKCIEPGQFLAALVRARNASEIKFGFAQDLQAAVQLDAGFSQRKIPAYTSLLFPRDFEELPAEQRRTLVAAARDKGIGVMVCPETAMSLETDATRRLESSRILRE